MKYAAEIVVSKTGGAILATVFRDGKRFAGMSEQHFAGDLKAAEAWARATLRDVYKVPEDQIEVSVLRSSER